MWGRILCWFGFHNWAQLHIDGVIATITCSRCGETHSFPVEVEEDEQDVGL